MHQDKMLWIKLLLCGQALKVRPEEYSFSQMILKTTLQSGIGMDNSVRPRCESRKQEETPHDLHKEEEIQLREHITELVKANEALQVEITTLQQAEQLALRQTQTLHHTLSALTAEPYLDKVLDQVLIAIAEQLAVSSCVVWLCDPKTETRFLYIVCTQGQILTGAQLLVHPNALKLHFIGQNPVWLAKIQASHPVIIDDIANYSYLEPQQLEYVKALGIKGLLEVPLIHDKKVIGSLVAYNTERECFTTIEVELAQALTHQVILAIELSDSAEKAKQEVQQSAVVEERNRIAGELRNSLRHLQGELTSDNTYPFDDPLNMVKASYFETHSYLLQDMPIEESTEKICSIQQDRTQLETVYQEKMIANVSSDEHNKLEKLPSGLLKLTKREREVLQMVASGANNKEIAEVLCLSEGTVRNHISNILSRLNVRDRTKAALIANTYSSFLKNEVIHSQSNI